MKEFVAVVPWQASDAVENFFMERGALGVSIEKFDIKGPTETVRGFFLSDQITPRLKRSFNAYLKDIEAYFPSKARWRSSIRVLPASDWQERWKVFFRPVRVTPRLVIQPPWETYKADGHETVVEIDPGMAFGTGLHASTRLCLEIIDEEIDRRIGEGRGVALLDVGTGSGILAIAAAKLGARPVMGIDIDERVIAAARQNVKRNRVEGSAKISSRDLDAIVRCFDLVIANIDFKTLADLKVSLTPHVSLNGRLVLSGILKEERDGLKEMFGGVKLRLVKEENREGWSALVFERS